MSAHEAADLLRSETAHDRALGTAKGLFAVPDEFFDPLPEDILAGFEGRA